MVLDGWVIRGDPAAAADPDDYSLGISYGDYHYPDGVLIRADIQNMRLGVYATLVPGDPWGGPSAPTGVATILDSKFRNYMDILVRTPYFTGGGPQMSPRTTIIRNSTFGPPPVKSHANAPQGAIVMQFAPGIQTNIAQSDRVFVYDFNQVPGNDFQVFYLEQAPDFVVPAKGGTLGGLEAGLTNQANWERHRASDCGTGGSLHDAQARHSWIRLRGRGAAGREDRGNREAADPTQGGRDSLVRDSTAISSAGC